MTYAIQTEALALTAGTGIATYASNLATSLRGMGHSTEGVFEVKSRIGGKYGLLDEIQLYDARLGLKRPVADFLLRAYYRVHGDPIGARARRLAITGQVLGAASPISSGVFESVYGVPHLGLRAEMHFKRYGSLMPIRGMGESDVFHATQPIALRMRGIPNLYTLHDIIPLRLPYATLDDKRFYYELLRLHARKADRLVTVSECSRRDIISVFKVPEERIVNTYQSVTLPAALLAASEDEVAMTLENGFGLAYKGYYLSVGAIESKKNVKRLIAGYAASGTKRPLVLAGGLGWQYEKDVLAIEDERFLRYRMEKGALRPERSVRHLDYVSRQDLVMLLRGARALVFPSLYEGFGLPVLEAMLAGTPVITSNVSSLPEVAGEAAEFVNPFETETIARAIRRLDQDDERCAELSALGRRRVELFSPERYRERLAELYRGLQ